MWSRRSKTDKKTDWDSHGGDLTHAEEGQHDPEEAAVPLLTEPATRESIRISEGSPEPTEAANSTCSPSGRNEGSVPRFVDFSHPARGDGSNDLVGSELTTGLDRHECQCRVYACARSETTLCGAKDRAFGWGVPRMRVRRGNAGQSRMTMTVCSSRSSFPAAQASSRAPGSPDERTACAPTQH